MNTLHIRITYKKNRVYEGIFLGFNHLDSPRALQFIQSVLPDLYTSFKITSYKSFINQTVKTSMRKFYHDLVLNPTTRDDIGIKLYTDDSETAKDNNPKEIAKTARDLGNTRKVRLIAGRDAFKERIQQPIGFQRMPIYRFEMEKDI